MNPEVTSRKIAELHALRSRISRWRFGTPIAVIAVMVVALMTLYNAGESLARPGPNRDAFVESVQQGMKDDVEPIVRHVALQTFHATKNSVQGELTKISERTPEFAEAMYQQVETLVENIPQRTQAQLSDILAESFAKQEGTLKEMFPDVTEENVNVLVERLVALAASQAEHVSTKLFEDHLVSMNNIITDLEAIEKSENVQAADEFASWEMALLVFDILRSEFDEVHPAPDNANDASAPAPPTETADSSAK